MDTRKYKRNKLSVALAVAGIALVLLVDNSSELAFFRSLPLSFVLLMVAFAKWKEA